MPLRPRWRLIFKPTLAAAGPNHVLLQRDMLLRRRMGIIFPTDPRTSQNASGRARDGVSLNCTECSATIKIPSPVEALELEDPEINHADQIINLVKLILKHLDECKPTDE
jgi:hypothetical protein